MQESGIVGLGVCKNKNKSTQPVSPPFQVNSKKSDYSDLSIGFLDMTYVI